MRFSDLPRVPELHCRLRPDCALSRSVDGTFFVLRRPRGMLLPFAPYEEAFAAALDRLPAGAHASELRDLAVAAGGPDRASAFMIVLRRLACAGFVEFPLHDAAGERAVLLPQHAAFVPSLAEEPAAGVGLDRFAFIRRDDRGWLLESPLAGARLSFSDLAALETSVVRRALASAGFLNLPEKHSLRREALEQWEFHDLAFHCHHREGWHHDPMGATFPHRGRIPPLAAVRPPWDGDRTALPAAASDHGGRSLVDVLAMRASHRSYDPDRPISLGDIGALFDRAARIRCGRSMPAAMGNRWDGMRKVQRPYPTGGACGELELYLAVDRAADVQPGLYHYDAEGHALVRISGPTPAVEALLADARTSAGGIAATQTLVIVTARFARVMWKYSSIAYATILRDTGVLYQTLYLAATDLGLSPCALGKGNAATFAEATGLDPVVEGSVGEFLVGGRPWSR